MIDKSNTVNLGDDTLSVQDLGDATEINLRVGD